MLWLSPLLAALLAAAGGGVVFALLGYDPWAALGMLFLAPLSSLDGLTELGLKATPLLLCALGIAIGVRANVWNIGAEGQLTMGAIAGGGVALAFGGAGHWWVLPLMLLAGVAGGAAWGALPALLRTRFNAHEILTTLMLNYVAIQILGWLVHGPWIDPEGFNFPQTRMFEADALLPVLVEGSRLHAGFLLALLAVPLGWLLLARTVTGFRLRTVGQAPAAARYAGFSASGAVWFSLVLSGALAGLAGVSEAAGPVGQLQPSMSPGYGFAAIIVAFLGRLNPVGILFASLLMALLYLGGEQLQVSMQLPLAATGTIQGMLLFFLLATDVFIDQRLVLAEARHA
ncbi:ABC transporter permease [Roseicella aquatilis]|uniref:ABC transporter permease n=2 Tax=Roseicella aquatilis TaxID=2527868 RepID=A0A4R4DQV8_9PROT|nr:ABC transporter permease [Roseicella aquatilis]